MTTFPETSSFSRDNPKRIQEPYRNSVSIDEDKRTGKRNMAKLNDEKNEYTQEKQNLKSWKNQEFCKVHATKSPGKSDSRNDNSQTVHQEKSDLPKNILHDVSGTDRYQPEESANLQITPNSNVNNKVVAWTDVEAPENMARLCKKLRDKAIRDNTIITTLNSKDMSELTEIELSAKEIEATCSEKEECFAIPDTEENDNLVLESQSSKFGQLPSSLPDILNTLQTNPPVGSKTTNNEDTVRNDEIVERTNLENENKSKSVLSQSSYVSHPLSSDSFSNETEAELKKLRTLQSLKANQSIYKLAYDENITDQSNSRSPSPIDPESQVPSSIPNSEILIHEAGSDSEAGSEDVELISHRYESETSLNENKHMYVNKLSLAVELLRTQETLPYDDQFKRVVTGDLASKENKRDTAGEVNFAFVEDSYSLDSFDDLGIVTTQSEASRHLKNGAVSDLSESCEMAKEVVETVSNPICKMCSVS